MISFIAKIDDRISDGGIAGALLPLNESRIESSGFPLRRDGQTSYDKRGKNYENREGTHLDETKMDRELDLKAQRESKGSSIGLILDELCLQPTDRFT